MPGYSLLIRAVLEQGQNRLPESPVPDFLIFQHSSVSRALASCMAGRGNPSLRRSGKFSSTTNTEISLRAIFFRLQALPHNHLLGSEKIRLMEQKIKLRYLSSASS